jgi:hypothetical protein
MERIGGTISVKIDGEVLNALGNFTYNLGRPKREAKAGQDRVHGYTETPQVPFIEGEVTDRSAMDLAALVMFRGTVFLELANGKSIVLNNAVQTGEGTGNTAEGNIGVRFEGETAEEVPA